MQFKSNPVLGFFFQLLNAHHYCSNCLLSPTWCSCNCYFIGLQILRWYTNIDTKLVHQTTDFLSVSSNQRPMEIKGNIDGLSNWNFSLNNIKLNFSATVKFCCPLVSKKISHRSGIFHTARKNDASVSFSRVLLHPQKFLV